MKLRKLLVGTLMLFCFCSLASCNTDTKDDSEKEEPVKYPYMDYMLQTVYATSNIDSVQFKFKSQGSDKIDNVVTSSTTTFNNASYEGLVFTMKETSSLDSVTYTITAEEDIVYSPAVYGHATTTVSKLSKFMYKCGAPGKLKAGESKIVTVTYGNESTFTTGADTEAAWDSWSGASESDRRFAIFVMVWKDDSTYAHPLIHDYTKKSLFKISNVSFNFA